MSGFLHLINFYLDLIIVFPVVRCTHRGRKKVLVILMESFLVYKSLKM